MRLIVRQINVFAGSNIRGHDPQWPGVGNRERRMGNEDQELVEDLQQRIHELETQDEADFGTFRRVDYVILAIGAVILPVLALIWAR